MVGEFHKPPAPKGIYGFVWPYIGWFLLGGYQYPKERGKGVRNRISWVRDKEGNKITSDHPDYRKYIDNQHTKIWSAPLEKDEEGYAKKWALYLNTNRKKFKYNGDIWHHLKKFVKPFEIINEHGSWIKTDMTSFKRAFKKAVIDVDKRNYVMDDLEVFIEDKI